MLPWGKIALSSIVVRSNHVSTFDRQLAQSQVKKGYGTGDLLKAIVSTFQVLEKQTGVMMQRVNYVLL